MRRGDFLTERRGGVEARRIEDRYAGPVTTKRARIRQDGGHSLHQIWFTDDNGTVMGGTWVFRQDPEPILDFIREDARICHGRRLAK